MLVHQKKAKEATIRKIFRECLSQKEFTSITLQRAVQLSKPTINDVLLYLEDNNLITESGKTNGDVGRKARMFQINPIPWFNLSIAPSITTVTVPLLCGGKAANWN